MKKFMMFLVSLFVALPAFATPDVVNASSFGFNKADATFCLQKAIDSGAKKVVVDNVGSPWFVDSIKLRSNLELVIADGVEVSALRGGLKHRGSVLFAGRDVDNVILRGEGKALISMPKADYQESSKYEWSSHRHAVSFRGSHNIVIRDLTINGSGGDGLYISNSSRGGCRNVLIENVICDDHHRQGISIISATDLLIRNCKFINTSGAAPQCGIDIEPNNYKDVIVNNVIENCEFYGNAAGGISVFLPYLTTPVSIVFRNCVSYNNGNCGARVMIHSGKKGEVMTGTVKFENCRIYDNSSNTLGVGGLSENGIKVTFKDCVFDHRKASGAAITFNNTRVSSNFDGLHFENCTVYPGKQSLFEVIKRTGFGVKRVTGTLKVVKGAKSYMADFKALSKLHPENKDLQQFEFAEIDFDKLRPLNSFLSTTNIPSWRLRGNAACVLIADKPGEYSVRFKTEKVNAKRNVRFPVTVKLGNNTFVEKFMVTDDDYTYRFKSPGKRIYILELTGLWQSVNVSAPHPGFGILLQNRQAFFKGGKKIMYFYVQPGVKEFKVEIQGAGNEWVTASLIDPAGKVVASCVKNKGAAIFKGVCPGGSRGEVWILQVQGKEDHSIRLSAPLIPIAAASPEQLFTFK